MIVDFRRNPPALPPTHHHEQHCDCSGVIQIPAPQFLRTWSGTITLSPLWKRPSRGCTSFASWGSLTCHRSCWIIESVLCTSITIWFSSATKSDLRRLRRVVRTAERIIGTTLPTLQELYSSRVSKRAGKITVDPSHPAHSSLNCYRLVDATELWAPERPDTGTVSSLRQSISWIHLT